MRNLITLILVGIAFQIGFSQVKKNEHIIVNDSISNVVTIQTNASYKGGINNFYNYIGNNYNFNNVKPSDVLAEFKDRDIMTIYLQFTVNEEGKPVDFTSINTTNENTFYKEAVRVISSTRWTPAKINEVIVSEKFRIPIQAYIRDFID